MELSCSGLDVVSQTMKLARATRMVSEGQPNDSVQRPPTISLALTLQHTVLTSSARDAHRL